MHLKNCQTPFHVRLVNHDLPIETPGSQQCRIEYVGAVRRRYYYYPFIRRETVHLDQQLIESLLALVMPAAEPRAALTPDRVDFVDEYDARRIFLGLRE